ncbi:MAG TPA: response regulator transcription factor [Gemmatimonadaceae bacterium]|nr:response regulator transcription factor [Gemmatimonadaceae bacterium]
MIRVLLVDDHPLVLEGLRGLMESEPGIEVVGTTTDGARVADLARLHRPDVVVLDLELGATNGYDVLTRLRAEKIPARVLVLTAYGDGESLRAALEHHADGIALKTDSPARTIDAIRAVNAGVLVFPQAARRWMRKPADHAVAGPSALSDREREVWAHLASGLSNAAIARKLGVSASTVKFHTQNLFQKLGVGNRTAAAVEYEKQIPAAARGRHRG